MIERCQNHVRGGSRVRRHYLHHDYAPEKLDAWAHLGTQLQSMVFSKGVEPLEQVPEQKILCRTQFSCGPITTSTAPCVTASVQAQPNQPASQLPIVERVDSLIKTSLEAHASARPNCQPAPDTELRI